MARTITINLSHDLGEDEARRRVKEGFEKITSQLAGGIMVNVNETWLTENSVEFEAHGLGVKISGTIDIFPNDVRIIATLPGLLASLAETIMGRVENEGRVLLENKKA